MIMLWCYGHDGNIEGENENDRFHRCSVETRARTWRGRRGLDQRCMSSRNCSHAANMKIFFNFIKTIKTVLPELFTFHMLKYESYFFSDFIKNNPKTQAFHV